MYHLQARVNRASLPVSAKMQHPFRFFSMSSMRRPDSWYMSPTIKVRTTNSLISLQSLTWYQKGCGSLLTDPQIMTRYVAVSISLSPHLLTFEARIWMTVYLGMATSQLLLTFSSLNTFATSGASGTSWKHWHPRRRLEGSTVISSLILTSMLMPMKQSAILLYSHQLKDIENTMTRRVATWHAEKAVHWAMFWLSKTESSLAYKKCSW